MKLKVYFAETDQRFNARFGEIQTVGKDGVDGASAYEIAVANGFKGTEAEWLESLQGADGKDGAPGVDGKDGADGYTPIRGTDYWTPDDIAEIKSYVDEAILGGAW